MTIRKVTLTILDPKSHVAELMKKAIEERERQQQRAQAIEAVLKLKAHQKPISSKKIKAARKEIRSCRI